MLTSELDYGQVLDPYLDDGFDLTKGPPPLLSFGGTNRVGEDLQVSH